MDVAPAGSLRAARASHAALLVVGVCWRRPLKRKATRLAAEFVTNVPPHGQAVVYDGDLSGLLAPTVYPVSCWTGRTVCELQFQFDPAPKLPAPIRVLCEYSSPPL